MIPWRLLGWLAASLAIIAIGGGGAAEGQAGPGREVRPDATVQGRTGGSESRFEIPVNPQQFLRLVIIAEAPVRLRLTDPDGRSLADALIGPAIEVPVSAAAGRGGLFSVRIQAAEAGGRDIGYRFAVSGLRSIRPDDAARSTADSFALRASEPSSITSPEAAQAALKNYAEALRLYDQLNEPEGAVRVQVQSGRLLFRTGETERAARMLESAVQRSRQSANRRMEGIALSAISAVYALQGKAEEAVAASRASLQIARDAADVWLEAHSLVSLGDALYGMGQLDGAAEAHVQALALWRGMNWKRGEAESLCKLGLTYMDRGDENKALEPLTRSQALWQSLGDRGGTADVLQAFGILYFKLDDKQKALDCYQAARELLPLATGKRRRAALLSTIGLIYFDLRELTVAAGYYRQALEIARSIRFPLAEGAYLQELGRVSFEMRDYARAREYFQSALSAFERIGDRKMATTLILDQSLVHIAEGNPAQALAILNGVKETDCKAAGPYVEAKCLENIGRAYQAAGDIERAFQGYQEALNLLQAGSYRYREAQIRLQLARLERDRGNLDQAYKQSASAVEIIESVRLSVPGPEFRASYFSSTHEYFEFQTDLLMRLHRVRPAESLDAVAFQVTERGRARSLLDRLAEAKVKIREGVDPGLLERETDLKRRLNRAAARQADLPANAKAALESAAKEIQDLNNEYQQVEALIRARSPKYAALMQPEPLTLAQVQRELLDGNTVLLEYALGEECSYLWAVSADSYSTFRLPGRSAIEKPALRLRTLLTAYETPPGGTTRERRLRIREAESRYWTEAAALSEVLLGPVAAIIANKRLLIVTDGALDFLPFAALPVPKRSTAGAGVPLVVEHELVRLPSASSLAVLRSQNAGRKKPGKWLAVMADPVFEADDPRMPKQPQSPVASSPARASGPAGPESNIVYRRLPATRGEADAITKLVPAGEATTALGFAANRGFVVNADLNEYRIVHFATHITAHYAQPELSGVVLSRFDKAGSPQEGLLRLHDIYNLRLPVELVVLSGCESYLGKQVRGEGLLGIVRGFMYAGSNRVIASLWKVDDLATKELMERFYRNMLGKGEAPAAALRNAQVEMWQQPDWRSPFYWAAFVLQGEWR